MILLISVINLLYNALFILIIARIIISFIPPTTLSPYHPIRRTVYDLTEPLLAPIRRILPAMGFFDLSPMILLIGADLLRRLLFQLLLA